jgi:hypothetical protein
MSASRQFVPVARAPIRKVRLQPSRYIPCANLKSRHLAKKDKPSLAMSTRRHFSGRWTLRRYLKFYFSHHLCRIFESLAQPFARYSEARELKCYFTFPTQRSSAFLAPLHTPPGYLHSYFVSLLRYSASLTPRMNT